MLIRLLAATGSAALLAASSLGAPHSPPPAPAPAPAPAAEAAPRAADLSSKVKVGDAHRYTMLIDSSMNLSSAELPGYEQKQRVNQTVDFVLTLKESDPQAGSTVEVKYEALKFTIDSPNLQGSFDSTAAPPEPKPAPKPEPTPDPGTDPGQEPGQEPGQKPEPADVNEADAALRPIIGTVLTVKVDPSGKVTEVTGGDALTGLDFWGQVAKQFAEREIVASFVEPILSSRHPAEPAAVGDTWSHVDTLESPLGSFRIITDHTLESVSDGEAMVTLGGKIETVPPPGEAPPADGDEPKPEEPAAPPTPPAFEIKDSSNSGSYTWDTAAGILKSLKQDQSVKMTTTMQGFPMDIDNKTSMQITRK